MWVSVLAQIGPCYSIKGKTQNQSKSLSNKSHLKRPPLDPSAAPCMKVVAARLTHSDSRISKNASSLVLDQLAPLVELSHK